MVAARSMISAKAKAITPLFFSCSLSFLEDSNRFRVYQTSPTNAPRFDITLTARAVAVQSIRIVGFWLDKVFMDVEEIVLHPTFGAFG